MTKAELVNEIARKTGIERAAVLKTVEAFMDTVTEALIRDELVTLRTFGNFVVRARAQKVGRDISKGKSVVIPAHKVPAFKPSKLLLNRIRTGK